MKRRVFLAGGSAIALGAAAAAAFGFGGGDGGTAPRSNQAPKTADITKTTLVDYEEVDGELGYGDPVPLRYNSPAGLVTWLPPVGWIVERGQPLFKVDNVPVALLFGALPLYRPLAVGVTGPDVKQLEENLRALGHSNLTPNEEFTSATAVKKWQKALGVTETGVIAPGQLLYTAGAIRVAEHKVRVGDQAGGEIVTYTGNIRHVIVGLPVNQQRFAVVGGAVQVTLPDGKALAGKVESLGTIASSGSSPEGGSGPATLPVTISIADQAAIGAIQQGPVKVRFVAEERKDVFTVPIAALVALAEGGYGVQVVEGSTTRYLAVETGMFANGRVEIRGNGVQAGMKVGVPK